jgi:hypothetical protein
MTDEVALVQALHYDDDRIVLLVVEPGNQRCAILLDVPRASRIGHGIGRLERVIDDDHISAAAGQRTAHGGGQTRTPLRSHDFNLGILRGIDLGTRENAPVPIRCHNGPAVVAMLDGKVLRVTHADDPAGGIVTQHPSLPIM